MGYEIRARRPDDWEAARDLRLTGLKDPASSVAFVNTYETEAAFTEDVWRHRAETPAFVAVDGSGEWVGTVTVLVEEEERQTHLVGVFVRPEHRGTGLAEELLRAAVDWSWELPQKTERVRLWVHGENPRAQAFYSRLGFTRTGQTMAFPLDETQTEYEMVLPRQ